MPLLVRSGVDGGRNRLGSGRGRLEPRGADRATSAWAAWLKSKTGTAPICSQYRTRVEMSSHQDHKEYVNGVNTPKDNSSNADHPQT